MILLIDTTSSKIRIAFERAGAALVIERAAEKQSAELPKMVAELLASTVDAAAIKAIGVVVGPGSFTGIRLGIAFAKGLAMGYGVPIVGISIFDLCDADVSAIDSGRGDYFVRRAGAHTIEKTLPADARLIGDYNLGDGIDIVREKLRAAPAPVIPLYIRPSYVEVKN